VYLEESKTDNFKNAWGSLKGNISDQTKQTSKNDCIEADANNFNSPREDLKNSYHVHFEDFDFVELSSIITFEKVAFSSESGKSLPILVTDDNKKYFCIYGKELIEAAKSSDDLSIRCFVKHLNGPLSERLLAVKATAIRIRPEGDPISYAEIITAVKKIFEAYAETGISVSHIEHGGARRGEAFKVLQENDFISQVLVPELGKSRQTILNYISDGNLLSDVLLQFLIDQKADKQFFAIIRSKKNECIRSIEEGLAEEESLDVSGYLEKIVSENVQKAFAETKNNQTISAFALLPFDENRLIEKNAHNIIFEIEQKLRAESYEQMEGNMGSEQEQQEVTFPNIGTPQTLKSQDEINKILRAELQQIYDDFGKILADESVTNLKDEALKISSQLLKLHTKF